MGEAWTDEPLDDLRDSLVEFRAETRQEFAAFRQEMRDEFAALRSEMKDGFDGIQRLMIQFMGVMIAALIGLVAATQL